MVQGRLQQIPAFAIHDSHEASAGVPVACRKAQAPTWSAFVIWWSLEGKISLLHDFRQVLSARVMLAQPRW